MKRSGSVANQHPSPFQAAERGRLTFTRYVAGPSEVKHVNCIALSACFVHRICACSDTFSTTCKHAQPRKRQINKSSRHPFTAHCHLSSQLLRYQAPSGIDHPQPIVVDTPWESIRQRLVRVSCVTNEHAVEAVNQGYGARALACKSHHVTLPSTNQHTPGELLGAIFTPPKHATSTTRPSKHRLLRVIKPHKR